MPATSTGRRPSRTIKDPYWIHIRGGGGIRTLTGDGLSALPLPVGLRPLHTILDRVQLCREDGSGTPHTHVFHDGPGTAGGPGTPGPASGGSRGHGGHGGQRSRPSSTEAQGLPSPAGPGLRASGSSYPGTPEINGRARSKTTSSSSPGADSSRVCAPKIMVARSAAPQGRQAPMPG